MRLNQLALLRYGKFTDKRVDFPRAERDFHLVVGPNEAGKSTLRQAVLDVLFGIENRTPLSFLHAKSEMRLGAELRRGDKVLRFERAKAMRNTLRDEDDAVLDDQVLAPFLDGVSKDAFKKMFNLDHERLLQGGQDMLAAKDDLGQVLFQAASGIGDLGRIHDALKTEATQLWAPKRAKDRRWYEALDQLEQADRTLKQVILLTPRWKDADRSLRELERMFETARARHQDLRVRRDKLERVRRWAPAVGRLEDLERKASEQGEVVILPADAASTVERAGVAMAQAEQRLSTHQAERARLEENLRTLSVDDEVLRLRGDIEALEAMRHRCAQHAEDLSRYHAQAILTWKEIQDIVGALPWAKTLSRYIDTPYSDYAIDGQQILRRRLPTLPRRRQLEQLMRQRAALDSALDSARRNLRKRESDAQSLRESLSGLEAASVSASLREAVQTLSKWDDPDRTLLDLQRVRERLQEQAEQAVAVLAEPGLTLRMLSATAWPSGAAISTLHNERQDLVAQRRAADQRLTQARESVEGLALELGQYKRTHRSIDPEAVGTARAERDRQWENIESGKESAQSAGPVFRRKIAQADELLDRQLSAAQELAGLQSLEHALERERLTLAQQESQFALAEQALAQFDERWARMLASWGLSERPLATMHDWLACKDRALSLAEQQAKAHDDERVMRAELQACRIALLEALQAAPPGVVTRDAALKEQRRQARAWMERSDAATHRRAALSEQLAQIEAAIRDLRQEEQAALRQSQAWREQWRDGLRDLGLEDVDDLAQVSAILELLSQLSIKLDKLREIQDEQLSVIRQDLRRFDTAAGEIAARLDEQSDGEQVAAVVSRDLAARLAHAREQDAQRRQLLQESQHAKEQERMAQEAADLARAALQPLFACANVSELPALSEMIERSDVYRRNQAAQDALRAELLDAAHGHSLAQIRADVADLDAAAVDAELERLEQELESAVHEQNRLVVDKAEAARVLAGMHGADDAARAESQRQEALASMAQIAERYIKVQTAAKLLRWAMDRYREEKQGPMLSRAGALFNILTLRSFERLVVDFEQTPLVLEGLRPTGERLGIDAMTVGTRDQLFLALRLAAMDMHVAQSGAMPFVADDLFVNYDDARTLAGLNVLADLSGRTQVIFLSHHEHIEPLARTVFGPELNVIRL